MTKNVFNKIKFIMQIPLKVMTIKFLWHQAWPHNDLRHLKNKAQQTRIVSLSSQPIPMKDNLDSKCSRSCSWKCEIMEAVVMQSENGWDHDVSYWKSKHLLIFFWSFQPQPQRPKTLRVCCANAHKRLEAVVEAEGGYIKDK